MNTAWRGLCTASGLHQVLAANLFLAGFFSTYLRLQYGALQADIAQEVALQPQLTNPVDNPSGLTSEVGPTVCMEKRIMVGVVWHSSRLL